jgi:fibronectin type 3 domain-containing protein
MKTGKKILTALTTIIAAYYFIALLGTCTLELNPDSADGPQKKVPPAPENVIAETKTETSIDLNWNAGSIAGNYSVFRSNEADGPYTRIKIQKETSYTDTVLPDGDYFYYVTLAADNMGESAPSNIVSAITRAPSAPQNVSTIVESATKIVVSWEAVTGAQSYEVFRSSTEAGAYNPIVVDISGTSYADETVTLNNDYFYKVSARNILGESPLSDAAFGATKPLAAPTGLNAFTQSASSIKITWNAVSGASGYKLYRAANSAGPYSLAATVTERSFTDVGLTAMTAYYYKVSAVNGIGDGEQSEAVSCTTLLSAPAGLAAAVLSNSSITISWNSLEGAASYKLYHTASSNGEFALIASTAETSYTHTGLTAATPYYYKVAGVSPEGEGTLSESIAVTIVLPPAPEGASFAVMSATSIKISWDAVQGAAQYKVYHSNTTATGTYNLAATVSSINWTHTGLTINTDYYYKISAVNNIGEGLQSVFLPAKIAAPATPTGLTVTPLSHNSLKISWNAVSGATLYSVYRYTSTSVLASNIITSVSSTSYTNTGLDSFRQYYYKVAAVNNIGTSALSTTAISAYTQPIPLTEAVWYSGPTDASYSSYAYYSFPVMGGSYYIQWGNVGHTGEASTSATVSAYWKNDNSMTDLLSTSYFVNQTNGLANPCVINAPSSGYIIVKVAKYLTSQYHDIRFYRG